MLAYLVILPVLAGMLALGMQTGELYSIKRKMQNAADDAALAGSIDSVAGASSSTITADAQYEAQRNGFTNGTNNVSVSVAAPPTSGPNANTPGAVQVTITKSNQSFGVAGALFAWLGQSPSSFSMSATSVAAQSTYSTTSNVTTTTTSTTTSSSGDACMVALTPNAEQGLNFNNFSTFTSDCGIMSNGTASSNNSNASIYFGSFSSASVKYVWTRGSFYLSNYSTFTPAPATAKTSQTTAITDPYTNLTIPTLSQCNYTNYNPNWANPLVVSPGVYCGGLTIANGASTVNFLPGTYYIANGDLYVTSSSNISCPTCTNGAGVTFILTQTTGNYSNIGGVKISSDSTVSLSAPSSGAYAGILFYQDRNAPVGTMSSTSKIFTVSSISAATLNGAIYFPNNKIAISNFSNAGSSTTGCTVWVGRYLSFTAYSSAYVAGCKTYYGLTPPGVTTTTTTTTTTTAPVTTVVNKVRVLQ